jgi:hypothetical protein
MRVAFRAFYICCFVLVLSGCADLLPWPGFESHPAIFSYPEQTPATEVAEQVRCELARFVQYETDPKIKHETPPLLDPYGGLRSNSSLLPTRKDRYNISESI